MSTPYAMPRERPINKKVVMMLSVLVVVLGVVFGYFCYQYFQTTSSPASTSTSAEANPLPAPPPPPLPADAECTLEKFFKDTLRTVDPDVRVCPINPKEASAEALSHYLTNIEGLDLLPPTDQVAVSAYTLCVGVFMLEDEDNQDPLIKDGRSSSKFETLFLEKIGADYRHGMTDKCDNVNDLARSHLAYDMEFEHGFGFFFDVTVQPHDEIFVYSVSPAKSTYERMRAYEMWIDTTTLPTHVDTKDMFKQVLRAFLKIHHSPYILRGVDYNVEVDKRVDEMFDLWIKVSQLNIEYAHAHTHTSAFIHYNSLPQFLKSIYDKSQDTPEGDYEHIKNMPKGMIVEGVNVILAIIKFIENSNFNAFRDIFQIMMYRDYLLGNPYILMKVNDNVQENVRGDLFKGGMLRQLLFLPHIHIHCLEYMPGVYSSYLKKGLENATEAVYTYTHTHTYIRTMKYSLHTHTQMTSTITHTYAQTHTHTHDICRGSELLRVT
eukprot:GHVR01102153.1.p1 GENE.GHVR01102153.1~~GHVR01102153.1.p1  ORF type:complete len:492 (+),score=121.06 GHVR01102153.1:43-1518(+)